MQTSDPNTGTTPLRPYLLKAGHPGINAGDNSLIPAEITFTGQISP